jgi:hypothetical protein
LALADAHDLADDDRLTLAQRRDWDRGAPVAIRAGKVREQIVRGRDPQLGQLRRRLRADAGETG